MPDYYYFFFSYARANYDNARWEKQGNAGNYLNEFFDALCREVSDRTGRRADQVAYRDQNRLKASDFWDQGLIEGLQKSRVLLSLISPHYLKSPNCGRELAFFHKRFEQHISVAGDDQQAHRILPIFWLDTEHCLKYAAPNVTKLLKRCNHTQHGMPENYPAVGLVQMCKLRHGGDYEQLCQSLADRIVELADTLEPIPELQQPEHLGQQETLEELLDKGEPEDILSGPAGANIVYLVGTRDQMEMTGVPNTDCYGNEREKWCPFPESRGATVELLTREGAYQLGLNDLRNLGLPDRLAPLIETAKERNSPLLFVLDRRALSLQEISERMAEYDSRNDDNCGLVTAGGGEISEDQVKQVFRYKCAPNYLHHVWEVPLSRQEYVDSVASVLSGIKRQLMNRGKPDTTFGRRDVPGLSAPSGG